MIYTDGVHVIADTVEELHAFAEKIGMKREWFQDKPGKPHYDTIGMHYKIAAIKGGAARVSPRALVQILRYQHLATLLQEAEVELDGWATSFHDSRGKTPELQKQIREALQEIKPDPFYQKP